MKTLVVKTCLCVVLFCLSGRTQAQNPNPFWAEPPVATKGLTVESPDKIITPQSEVEDAIRFLNGIPLEDRPYILFFTTFAFPEDHREEAAVVLSFVCHSLVGLPSKEAIENGESYNAGSFYPVAHYEEDETAEGGKRFVGDQLVPDSKTLYWIDIRNFNWSAQAVENISTLDPYFRKPTINEGVYNALRVYSGNRVLRADWFIYHALEVNAQVDRDEKFVIYDELLYSFNKKPKTGNDFKAIWGFDQDIAERFFNEAATLVLKSRVVSRHNRILFGYRTPLGALYQTYDVKHDGGKRNLIEDLPTFDKFIYPKETDAGELISNNQLGLQVYILVNNQNDEVVTFGDPTVVRNMTDVHGDARVRTAHSCIHCHGDVGILRANNVLVEYQDWLGLRVPDKQQQLKIERVYMARKFEELVNESQAIYKNAVFKATGLTAAEKQVSYLKLVQWYTQELDIDQMASESGFDTENFTRAITSRGRIPARLKLALHPTKPIKVPRSVWDDVNSDGRPGLYGEASVLAFGISYDTIQDEKVSKTNKVETKEVIIKDEPTAVSELVIQEKPKIVEVEAPEPTPAQKRVFSPGWYANKDTKIYYGSKVIGELKEGDRVDINSGVAQSASPSYLAIIGPMKGVVRKEDLVKK